MITTNETTSSCTSKQIKTEITSGEKGKLYFPNSFSTDFNIGAVTRALSRLEKEGILVRLAQGVYLYPETNRFGIVRPSLDEIASAIAHKDNALIIAAGSTALNKLGLSDQVPLNAVYHTTGSGRIVKIGTRKIRFKHTAPRNFVYKSKIMPLIVEAMKALKEENVDDKTLKQIEEIVFSLKKEELDSFRQDINNTPIWIRKQLQNILNNNKL